MGSATALVLLTATVCLSSTVAQAPCKDDIIKGLPKHDECYHKGKTPKLRADAGRLTYVGTTRKVPDNDLCVIGRQDSSHGYGIVYFKDGSEPFSWIYNQTSSNGYIKETDTAGLKYRIYPIRNENHVYSFYRCLEVTENKLLAAGLSKGGSSSGIDEVDVAVDCGYVNDDQAKRVITEVQQCLGKLGIGGYKTIHSCDC